MNAKKIYYAIVIAGAIAIVTAVACAQSKGSKV